MFETTGFADGIDVDEFGAVWAVDRLLEAPEAASRWDDDALVEGLRVAEQLQRWAVAQQARLVVALDARRERPEHTTDEIAAELTLSRRAAEIRYAVARAVHARPSLGLAMAAGDLDGPKVLAIEEALGEVERVSRSAGLPVEQVEDLVVRLHFEALLHGPMMTVGELTAFLRKRVMAIDPAAAEQRRRRARRERSVEVRPRADGMAELWAYGPAELVASMAATLDACAFAAPAHRVDDSEAAAGVPADALGVGADDSEPRSLDARRFDALVDLLLAGATSGLVTGADGIRAQIHVHVGADTLAGRNDDPADLAGYGPLPAEVARAVARSRRATFKVHTDADIDDEATCVPEDGYRPSERLARAVRLRDRTCRFPGCRQPAWRADLDHTIPWPQGTTCAHNLGALCRRHHRLKQTRGWRLQQLKGGVFVWTSPAGRRYIVGPDGPMRT